MSNKKGLRKREHRDKNRDTFFPVLVIFLPCDSNSVKCTVHLSHSQNWVSESNVNMHKIQDGQMPRHSPKKNLACLTSLNLKSLSFQIWVLFKNHFSFSSLYVSLSVFLCHMNAGAHRNQRRAPDSWELELHMVMSCHGKGIRVCCESRTISSPRTQISWVNLSFKSCSSDKPWCQTHLQFPHNLIFPYT